MTTLFEMIPGWLFGISQARVAPALQEKLNRYREEVFKVPWNAFKGDIMPTFEGEKDALSRFYSFDLDYLAGMKLLAGFKLGLADVADLLVRPRLAQAGDEYRAVSQGGGGAVTIFHDGDYVRSRYYVPTDACFSQVCMGILYHP